MKTAFTLLALFATHAALAADKPSRQAAPVPKSSALSSGTIKSKVVDPVTNAVTETISDPSGKLIKKTVFYFDANNWTTGAVHYGKDGAVRYKESYKRNAAGQMIESYLYSPTDQLLGKRTMSYDEKGQPSQIDDYNAAGRLISRALPQASSAQKKR